MTDAARSDLTEPARRLLECVLAGEVVATHPDVVAMMRQDPAFARTLERLLEIHHELIHLEVAPRDVGGNGNQTVAELEAAAVTAMRLHMRESTAAPLQRRTVRRRRLAIACAAVAIACAGVWLLQSGPAPDRNRQPLDGSIEISELARGDGLHFDYHLPITGHFEVQVLDGDRTLLPATRVNTADWRPAPELTADWPARVVVRVTAFADGGSDVASRSYEWRVRR